MFIHVFYTVTAPTVNVTALNNQTVGQSLMLQCKVTTVRVITSSVDIVWSSGDTELQRMRIINVSSTAVNNSLVYTDAYDIAQLNTTDDSRVIQCEAVINTNPPVIASGDIILDVTGMLELQHTYFKNIYELKISIHTNEGNTPFQYLQF